jgi:hypothetical protein
VFTKIYSSPTSFDAWFAFVNSNGVLGGAPVRITAADGFISLQPRVAWSGVEYGVVFTDNRPDDSYHIYFKRFDATGTAIPGSEITVASDPGSQGYAAIAWDSVDNEWGVAWIDWPAGTMTSNVEFARISSAGSLIPLSKITVNDVTEEAVMDEGSGNSPLTWNGSHWGLAWEITGSVVVDELDAAGGAVRVATIPTTTTVGLARATLVWDGGGYGVTYSSEDPIGRIPHFARTDATGFVVGSDLALTTVPNSDTPSIGWSGTEYAVAWNEPTASGTDLWMTRLDASGALIAGSRQQITCSPLYEWFEDIQWAGTRWGVIYEQDDLSVPTEPSDIRLARIVP